MAGEPLRQPGDRLFFVCGMARPRAAKLRGRSAPFGSLRAAGHAVEWQLRGSWCGIEAQVRGVPAEAAAGSLEHFLTDRYWGYAVRHHGSFEYLVGHAARRVWTPIAAEFRGNADSLHGSNGGRSTPSAGFRLGR